MNEAPQQFLAEGIEVLVVAQDGKEHRAKITEVIHPRCARVVSLDGKASAVSDYSETGEINTFHFPHSDKASSEAETDIEAS
jgi:hypothetical protein